MWHFSYEYLQEFLGHEPFCFENVFTSFALHRGFVHITSFIEMLQGLFFQEFNFMDLWMCVPNFLIRDKL